MRIFKDKDDFCRDRAFDEQCIYYRALYSHPWQMESVQPASVNLQQRAGARTGYFPEGNKTRDYIRNASCRFEIRQTPSGQSYVVSLPEPGLVPCPTTYLGSITGTLFDYPLSSLASIHHALTSETASLVRRVASRPRQSIGLFNEPFSNVLLPDNFLSLLEEYFPGLRGEYPEHPLFIRGLIGGQHLPAFRQLRQMGFFLIPYRRIFLFQETSEKNCSKHMKQDLARLQKYRDAVSCPQEPLPNVDYEVMVALYRKLYLGKYSFLNPDYTPSFLREMHCQGRLRLMICRNSTGEIFGFSGCTRQGNRMNANLVGHNREMMPGLSAYLLTNAAEAEYALQNDCVINFGAGAQKFKLSRGCIPDYEYIAMYVPPISLLRGVRDLVRSLQV